MADAQRPIFYLYQMRSSGACFASKRQRYHSISESVVLIFHAQQIVYFAYWLLAWQRLKRAVTFISCIGCHLD